MKKAQFVVSVLLLVSLLLAACAPKAAPAPAPQAPAPASASVAAPAAPAKPAWEVEWEKTLEAAKSEGKVIIATSMSGVARAPVTQGFQKAYGIPVESISGKGAEISQKLLAEHRAGLSNYDISMTGSTTGATILKPAGVFAPLDQALILPEVTDPELIKKIWWQEKLWWVDADHTMLAPMLLLNFCVAINTNLVKEGEIKSYRDLLNPKWQGKLVLNDVTIAGAGANFLTFMNDVFGWDYLVDLAKAKPIILRDQRQQLDWLAHDKVAILVAPKVDVLTEFMQVGAPIKGVIPAEGTFMVGGYNPSIFNRRPHPNAAKLFINWLLTKEGQTIIATATGYQSNRLDVSTAHLAPEQLRQSGMKYFIIEDEKLVKSTQPALMEKAKELFGPLMK